MILTALAGFTSESMTREAAWRFLDMGRRLERALNTALVVERDADRRAPTTSSPLLEAMLDAADSAMTYRRRYRATLQVAPVVDLLIADEGNPRSIVFQLVALAEHVAALPHDATRGAPQPGGAAGVRGAVRVPAGRRRRVCAREQGGARPALRDLLRGLVTNLQRLSDALSGSYLTPATISRSLSSPGLVA